jgi:hypothetical protein
MAGIPREMTSLRPKRKGKEFSTVRKVTRNLRG